MGRPRRPRPRVSMTPLAASVVGRLHRAPALQLRLAGRHPRRRRLATAGLIAVRAPPALSAGRPRSGALTTGDSWTLSVHGLLQLCR